MGPGYCGGNVYGSGFYVYQITIDQWQCTPGTNDPETPCSTPTCNLTATLASSSQRITVGQSVTFTGSVSVPVGWVLTIAGRTFNGSGSAVNVTWDGTDASGDYVSPATYTATLTATTCNCSATQSVPVEVDCDLTLSDPVAIKPTFAPYAGETTKISATASTVVPHTWTITVAGRTWSGTNNSPIAEWDGTGPDGRIVAPKTYQAQVTVTTQNGCSLNKTVDITVAAPNSCSLNPRLFSNVNVANGNLSHDQQLFSTKGGAFAAGVSLAYNSLVFSPGVLGRGWNHSYEIALTDNNDGTILFREGSGKRLYTLSGGVYVPQDGDSSTLVMNGDGSYTATESDGTRHNFDATGKILTRTDRTGNTLTFAYTGATLSGITDGAGRSVGFTYDASGRLSAVTDPNGNAFSFSYTGTSLTAVNHPDGGQWSYTYDAGGFLLTKTDPNGNTVTYTYDDRHRILSGTNQEGSIKSLVYPTATADVRNTSFTEPDGGSWTYSYDTTKGTLASKTDPLGNTTSYTYDANRNMLTKTEPVIGTTSYTYDANNNMTSMTDSLGNVTSYAYNGNGQVTTTAGPQGTTVNTYDATGNLLTATDPAGATTTYEYDARGNVTKVTNAKGQATVMTYNGAGLLASTTDLAGAVTGYTYDANGNMLTQTDPAGKVITFEYDAMNRLMRVTDPLGNATAYGYDHLGNRTSQTDANGNTTTWHYNSSGQKIEAKDAQNNTTAYAYGGTGCPSCGGGNEKLTSLTDAKGQATNWQYNLAGQLTGETDPLNNGTAYTYDAAGNLATRADPNGIVILYAYDPLRRLTSRTYPDGSTVTYTYDAAGRVLTAANANVSYTYAYDAAGRVTSVTDSRGYTITYEYDLLGNRTKMTFQPGTADERVTTYTYDDANRLTGITSPAGTFTYGYDALGRRISLTYPNQVVAAYAYDDAGRLLSLSHTAGSSNIAAFSYALDNVGNRTGRTSTETQNFFYDVIYRLLNVVSPKPEAFVYDAVGNRQTGPGAKDTAYLYNTGNQILQGRKLAYGYDANGNQTGRTVPGAFDKSWTQTWDYENRLLKVEKVKGEEKRTATFSYAPSGRRIGKQLTVVKDGVAKTSSWSYVYDNDNIALEVYTDETGAVTKTLYTHGAGIDEHLALERNGSYYYYHADGLGSIVSITDTNRNVVQSYEYDSFGMAKPSTNFRNSYTYTGREWDKETGLLYLRKRYLDLMEGRFVSKDPIGFKGGINLYSYALNNPLRYTDPYGEDVYVQNTTAVGGWHRRIVVDTPTGPYGISFGMSRRDAEMDGWSAASGEEPTPGGPGVGVVYPDNIDAAVKEVSRFATTPCEDEVIEKYLKSLVGNTGKYHYLTNSCRNFSAREFDKIVDMIMQLRAKQH